MMHYVASRHWPKFQTNVSTFQYVTSKKITQKQPEIVPSASMKTFEISKLENYKSDINETWPRYVPAEYH